MSSKGEKRSVEANSGEASSAGVTSVGRSSRNIIGITDVDKKAAKCCFFCVQKTANLLTILAKRRKFALLFLKICIYTKFFVSLRAI